jgi:RNA polymerase sigma factor (sigma-70 family)
MHETALSDAELLTVFRDPGHEAETDQFIERFRSLLFAVCSRILQQRQLEEDAVQEAWTRVVRKKQTYNGKDEMSAWLCRIARNAALDQCRKVAVQQKHTGGDFTLAEQTAPAPEEDDDMERAEQSDHLEEAIRQLPVEQQAVLLLVSNDNRARPGLGRATQTATAAALDYRNEKGEPDHNAVNRLLGSAYTSLLRRLSQKESRS